MTAEIASFFKKYKYTEIFLLFILSRIVFLLVMLLTGSSLSYVFSIWDSISYVEISQLGYYDERVSAFFPLLPIIIRFTTKIGAAIINNLAFLGSLFFLKKLECNDIVLAIFAFSPIGFLSMLLYSESLFVFFTIVSFYLMINHKNPILMGTLIGLSVLTRSTGALLFFAIFIGMCIQWYFKEIKFKDIVIAYAPATLISLIFPIYLQISFGNWKSFVDSQYIAWCKVKSSLPETIIISLKMIFTNSYPYRSEIYKPLQIMNEVISMILLITLITFIVISVIKMIKSRKLDSISITLALYVLLAIVIYNGTIIDPYLDAPTVSFYRYYYALFPLYMMFNNTKPIVSKIAFGFTFAVSAIACFLFSSHIYFY